MAYQTFQGVGSTFSVHRDHVGFVVGRQHGTLSKIGRETKTTLEVNDQDSSCQFVGIVIGGRSMDDVRAAYNGVEKVARAAESATPRVGNMPRMNFFGVYPLQGIERHVRVLCEDIGMVLGSGGATIKKISMDTSTWSKTIGRGEDHVMFSVRGFMQRNVDEAVKRILNIAQESLNRRRGGPRHIKTDSKMKVSEVATFTMAAVPKGRKKSFKVKNSARKVASSESVSVPDSPTYTADSPTYSPNSPTYAPDSPWHSGPESGSFDISGSREGENNLELEWGAEVMKKSWLVARNDMNNE
tara:strand:+ start:232 stop:1128 length:897 start_codon:yes stop_codon:yes gene_type:complete